MGQLDTNNTGEYNESMSNDSVSVEFRIRKIPGEHYWRFKALCALEKKGVNKKMLELIREAVEASELSGLTQNPPD